MKSPGFGWISISEKKWPFSPHQVCSLIFGRLGRGHKPAPPPHSAGGPQANFAESRKNGVSTVSANDFHRRMSSREPSSHPTPHAFRGICWAERWESLYKLHNIRLAINRLVNTEGLVPLQRKFPTGRLAIHPRRNSQRSDPIWPFLPASRNPGIRPHQTLQTDGRLQSARVDITFATAFTGTG